MQGHWIGGTRKLNRHWQSGKKGIVSRDFIYNLSLRVKYPQLNTGGGLSEVPWFELRGQDGTQLSNYEYLFPQHFANSPRIDFFLENNDTIPVYITPIIPGNNAYVSQWLHRFITYNRGDGQGSVGANVNNVTLTPSTSYSSVCMNAGGGSYTTMGMTGYRIDPGNEINITSFLPFFADNVYFLKSIIHTFGIDITLDQRFGDGTPNNTFKRAAAVDLILKVRIYRDNTVI